MFVHRAHGGGPTGEPARVRPEAAAARTIKRDILWAPAAGAGRKSGRSTSCLSTGEGAQAARAPLEIARRAPMRSRRRMRYVPRVRPRPAPEAFEGCGRRTSSTQAAKHPKLTENYRATSTSSSNRLDNRLQARKLCSTDAPAST